MSFLKNVYTPGPVDARQVARTAGLATTPEIVAGYVRLALTILGTLVGLVPALEVAGVPVGQWIATILGATCQ